MELIVFTLLIIAIIYTIIIFFHLILETQKIEKQTKNYYYGLSLFLLNFIIARIIFLVNDVIYSLYILYVVGNFFSCLAVFWIMLVVEKYVVNKRFKFIPSSIILIATVLVLFLPEAGGINLINVYVIISALMAVFIIALYIQIGFELSGRPRTKSFLLATGLIVFMIGTLLYLDTLQAIYPVFSILSPIIMMAGFAIVHYGLLFYSN